MIMIEPTDFESKEFEMMDSNQRSYANDESILVCEAGSNYFCVEIFDSLSINYKPTIIEEKTTTSGWGIVK